MYLVLFKIKYFNLVNINVLFTFHPKFSKNVLSRDCPVVFPPQGPGQVKKYKSMYCRKWCQVSTCKTFIIIVRISFYIVWVKLFYFLKERLYVKAPNFSHYYGYNNKRNKTHLQSVPAYTQFSGIDLPFYLNAFRRININQN